MTLYTCMPLELVLDGIEKEPGPMVEIDRGEVKMQLLPVAPGIGRLVRLLQAPLSYYLRPEYGPGSLVYYGTPAPAGPGEDPLFQPSSIM